MIFFLCNYIKSFHSPHSKTMLAKVVDNYEILGSLGEGVDKKAFEAKCRRTGEKVCLCTVRAETYERELRVGCQDFLHENVIRTLSHGKSEDSYFIVTELCSKNTLEDIVERSKMGVGEDMSRLLVW